MAAIFVTMDELIARAGSRDALAQAMLAFAAANGVDILCAVSAMNNDKGLKGVSILPARPDASDAAARLAAALCALPTGLSAELASNPLFVKQGIPEHGFAIAFDGEPAGVCCRARRRLCVVFGMLCWTLCGMLCGMLSVGCCAGRCAGTARGDP
eukprot:3905158-Prymnesium_polylepis.2